MSHDKTDILIDESLFEHVKTIAQKLGISHSQLVEIALEQFIIQYTGSDNRVSSEPGDINQGDIFWLRNNSEAEIAHPQVVIQENVFNHSRIDTVIVCALTTNMKKVNIPGNVLLEAGEADLAKRSIIEVAKVSTVKKAQLGDYIGSLSQQRIEQVLAGLRFQQTSFFAR